MIGAKDVFNEDEGDRPYPHNNIAIVIMRTTTDDFAKEFTQ